MSDDFNLKKPDIDGRVPDLSLIGKVFRHYKGALYTVTGFGWLGDTDQWAIRHQREGTDAECIRTVKNFFEDGRFIALETKLTFGVDKVNGGYTTIYLTGPPDLLDAIASGLWCNKVSVGFKVDAKDYICDDSSHIYSGPNREVHPISHPEDAIQVGNVTHVGCKENTLKFQPAIDDRGVALRKIDVGEVVMQMPKTNPGIDTAEKRPDTLQGLGNWLCEVYAAQHYMLKRIEALEAKSAVIMESPTPSQEVDERLNRIVVLTPILRQDAGCVTVSSAANAIARNAGVPLSWATLNDVYLPVNLLEPGMTVIEAIGELASQVKAVASWDGFSLIVKELPQDA